MDLANSNWNEATHHKIIRPQLAIRGRSYDPWITYLSPKWQRLAAVQLTRYLCIETGYRQDLDDECDSWKRHKTSIFSITECISGVNDSERQGLVGIITFHEFNEQPVLYHCYLHPFFRNKGRMEKAWQVIQQTYPKFEIEHPLSPEMERFLSKVNCDCLLN